MRVLVTGSEGVIGRVLVPELRRRGFTVATLDLRAGADYVGDVRSPELVRKAASNADAVVHLAALTSPVESWEMEGEYYSVNVGGTATVLRALGKGRLIVFASSCAVYGDAYKKLRRPLREEDDAHAEPRSPYALSKWMAEGLVRMHYRERGVHYAVLRLGNVYSPYDDKYVFSKLLTQDAFTVYDATAVRDFVSALDLADLVARILEKWDSGGLEAVTLNVGGEPLPVGELVRLFTKHLGRPRVVIHGGGLRWGEFHTMILDTSKARRLLGWEPRMRLSTGEGIRWLAENFWRGSVH